MARRRVQAAVPRSRSTKAPAVAEAEATAAPAVHVLYLRPSEVEFVALDSTVARLASRFAGVVKVSVIDEDELPPSLSDYARRRTPTLLVLRDGRLVGEALGEPPLRELVGLLAYALGRRDGARAGEAAPGIAVADSV